MNIVFLRHGEAEPRDETGDFVENDLKRRLTEKGRYWQVPTDLGKFDLVISSPAERAKETARIASGGKEPVIIKSLSTHLWDGDWESVDGLFVNRGNISLEEVYSNASDKEMDAVRTISNEALKEVENGISKNKKSEPRILIVGHAMFLPALAEAFVGKYAQTIGSVIEMNKIVLGEGESFAYLSPRPRMRPVGRYGQ
ncbi:MAG TPA: hypothetical protein ENI66_01685 [Candidatus Yonathbacteria bacterium]|nr:hypothetical protein [Candidatus Yonathbacteria bacterium]